MRIRKILCPVDFSKPSEAALEMAADLSAQFGASLTLLHAYAIPGYTFPEGIVFAGPEVLNDLLSQIDRSLGEWKAKAQARGAKSVDTASVQGSASEEIVRKAREGDYDLIVVGTHGRRGLKHALLGSTAEKVVRLAPCPVLTARALAK